LRFDDGRIDTYFPIECGVRVGRQRAPVRLELRVGRKVIVVADVEAEVRKVREGK
jgi:hypothetical protein